MDAVQLIKSGLDSATRNVARTIDGMTAEEIAWHPRPDANSIGLILFHMARSEDSLVNGMIRHQQSVWEKDKWYEKLGKAVDDGGSHYTAEQVENFEVPPMDQLHAYTMAVRKETNAYIDSLSAEDLDVKIDIPEGFPFDPAVGSLLSLVVNHGVGHAGEISYIRGLKRGLDG
ncbi:MAG: DinB family protein [Dehalococcoidales bacterium]|nr:DinB family protein [Dehalococcoidales bacterium]